MRELLERSNDPSSLLPVWNLGSSADEQLARHIANLRIPIVSGQPSLLLHALGEVNESQKWYISEIFSTSHVRHLMSNVLFAPNNLSSQGTHQHIWIRQNSATARGLVFPVGILFRHEARPDWHRVA